jgi:excisionase family DNA binding protein
MTTKKKNPTLEDRVSLAEAAKILNLDRSKLRKMVVEGKIKAIKVPGAGPHKFRYMIDRNELPSKPSRKKKKVYTKRISKAQEVETPIQAEDTSLQNHISFSYGYCLSWLGLYANSTGIPIQILSTSVGRLLQKGGL